MTRGLAHETAWMMAAVLGAAALDYVFTAVMAWVLPPASFGVLSIALTFFLLLAFFVGSGFPVSLSRSLAEQPANAGALVRFATLANATLGAVVVAAYLLLTFYGPLSPGPGYGQLTLLVAASGLLLAMGSTLHFALQGRMAFRAFGLLHASKSLAKFAVGIPLALLGFGVAGAAGGLLAGSAFVLLVGAYALRRELRAPGEPMTREQKRRYLRFTGAVFAGSLALVVLMNADLLAVKYLTPRGESDLLAAEYQSAATLAKVHIWLVLAAMNVFFPMLTRASQGGALQAAPLLRRIVRWTFLGVAPFVLATTLFATEAIRLVFPPVYVAAAPALAASGLGMGALAFAVVFTRALQASGPPTLAGVCLAGLAALQVALLVLLIPRYGTLGAGIATLVACTLGALVAGLLVMRAFRLRLAPRRLVAAALPCAAFAGVARLLPHATRPAILLAFALAGAAYLATAIATGLVTADERRAVLAQLARRPAAPAEAEA